MSTQDFVRSIVDGETVKAPLFTVGYATEIDGYPGVVAHRISNIIYNELDAQMARHLYATQGVAFPAVHVETSFTLNDGGRQVARSESSAPSIIDALATIGESATKRRGTVEFTIDYGANHGEESQQKIALTDDRFETMRRMLAILSAVADSTFCRISGDLDGATVFLPGPTERVFFEVDFKSALMSMPPLGENFPEAFRIAIYSFERERADAPALRARLRAVRDMMLMARKEAVDSFCQMAEREIAEFDRSMTDKVMTGFRHEIAMDLVNRLKMAFGDALKGLSPHARLLAFDWANSNPDGETGRLEDHVMAAE